MPLGAPLRNLHFIGRDSLLDELRAKLCDTGERPLNNCVALHGLGGVGKTQLAVQYMSRFHRSYNHMFWINAADQWILTDGFKEICERHINPVSTKAAPEAIINTVTMWLQGQRDWLLIVDNLDD